MASSSSVDDITTPAVEVLEDSYRTAMKLGEYLIVQQFPMFPSNLGRIGRERDYIAPRTVAIGPYYHRVPELQQMEKVKRTIVYNFFNYRGLGDRIKGIPSYIEREVGYVRYYYSDMDAVDGIANYDFNEMMFIDSCFLLLVISTTMHRSGEESCSSRTMVDILPGHIAGIIQQHIRCILRDMMLLENQIPWVVMKWVIEQMKFPRENIGHFLVHSYPSVTAGIPKERASQVIMDVMRPYSHLLGLLLHLVQSKERGISALLSAKARTCHASELAEMGIKLKARKITEFNSKTNHNKRETSELKMKVVKGPFFATLALQPLDLDRASSCLLTNLAAFELYTETSLEDGGEYPVSSYLCVLGLMMNQENDVRELRAKRILQGSFGDQQILEFFKALCPNLVAGKAYWQIFQDIEDYRKKRWLWIAIYGFVYNNAKTIVTVLSVIGVLVGIFKALLSLKSNPNHQ